MNESNYSGSGKSVELFSSTTSSTGTGTNSDVWIPRVVQATRRFNVGISHFPLVVLSLSRESTGNITPTPRKTTKYYFWIVIIISSFVCCCGTHIHIKITPSKTTIPNYSYNIQHLNYSSKRRRRRRR